MYKGCALFNNQFFCRGQTITNVNICRKIPLILPREKNASKMSLQRMRTKYFCKEIPSESLMEQTVEAVKNNLPGKPALKLNFGAKFYKPFWFKASACRHGEYVKRTNDIFSNGKYRVENDSQCTNDRIFR